MALPIIVFGAGLALLSVWLVDRYFHGFRMGPELADTGQLFGGAVATMFALVFALVTIAVWQNYDRVDANVGEEAGCLHNLYRNLESYPPAVRDDVRARLRGYARRVVVNEWPRMGRTGEGDDETLRLFTDLNTVMTSYRPASLGEVPLHQENLAQISQYRKLRLDRLRSANSYLDINMWIALVAGSLVLIGFCSFWELPVRKQRMLMAATVGTSLGIIFSLMLAFNHPFAGPAAIPPTSFQVLLDKYWIEAREFRPGAP